jgi:hypothetical protein
VALIPIDLNLAYLRRCLAHFDKDPVTQEKQCPTKCEIQTALSMLVWMTQKNIMLAAAIARRLERIYSHDVNPIEVTVIIRFRAFTL